MKCLVETAEIKKVCQAIFWALGQFDNVSGAPLPLRIEAGSSMLTFSQLANDHFIEFQIKARIEEPGVVFIPFTHLRKLAETMVTSMLNFSQRAQAGVNKFVIESEDGRVLLNELAMSGWIYPEKPKAYDYKCQSFLLNRASRQIAASATGDETFAVRYYKQHQNLWMEHNAETSCLAKIFCKGGEDVTFSLSTSKFCNMMRAITSWHVAETSFSVRPDHIWFHNGTGTFRMPANIVPGLSFGLTQMYFKEQQSSLQKVNLLRAGLISILETCVASRPSKDMVRLDWVHHNGNDMLRVSCSGGDYDVTRYTTSQGLINKPVLVPAKKLLDFLKTYADPVASFEVNDRVCYINIPKHVRFGLCLPR